MQCSNMLSANVQCDAQVQNEKITGTLCTKCFFALKRKANTPVIDRPDPIVTDIALPETQGPRKIELGKKKEVDEDNPESISRGFNPDPTIKYCQSCIERGYSAPKPATREWTKGYFICDDCFQPLLQNVMGLEPIQVAKVQEAIPSNAIGPNGEASPVFNQIYELLGIPENLRFYSPDRVVKNYNDIFAHRANAIVNMTSDQIIAWHEQVQALFATIRITDMPIQQYIDVVKHKEREEANLRSMDKARETVTKSPSKAKLSAEEKQAKALGLTVEKYREFAKFAKTQEFNKITGQGDKK